LRTVSHGGQSEAAMDADLHPTGQFRYAGSNHKPFHDSPAVGFEPENISEGFTYSDVQKMMSQLKM
jgi:hypothetical protein